MIYLDNAATSFPKPRCVYKRLHWCLRHAAGNPGRSSHRAALAAAEEIYAAREALCKLLCFSHPERIVFTQNATHALNLAIHSLRPAPQHVIYSDREHNSVIRPIEALRKAGCDHSVFRTDGDILAAMEAAMTQKTDLCILSLCSNVTGECFPLEILRTFRKRHPAIRVILDGSQWIGHLPFALSEELCDILCAPGHKALFGLQGTGFAAFTKDGEYEPLTRGGSGNESESPHMPHLLPERLEAGTLATPAISTLHAGVGFILRQGQENVRERLRVLTKQLYERLLALPNLHLMSENGFAIASFTADNAPASAVAEFLDTRGICVRSGLYCAPLIHAANGTLSTGAVRVSLSYLNQTKDLDRLYRALREFKRIYD